MRKGLLTQEEERWLARFLDRLVRFDNPIAEALDYYAFLSLVRIADNQFVNRFVPEKWLNPFRRLIDMSRSLDVDGIGALINSNYAFTFPVPAGMGPLQERMLRGVYTTLETKIYEGLINIRKRGMSRRQLRRFERQQRKINK